VAKKNWIYNVYIDKYSKINKNYIIIFLQEKDEKKIK